MTESSYSFLCYKSCATNGAMLTFGKTSFSTSRSLSVNLSESMCLLFNGYGSSADFVLAFCNGAVNNLVVRAGCGTGRINKVLSNCLSRSMSNLVNRVSSAAKLCLTYGTVNYIVVRTCSCASRSLFVFSHRLSRRMAGSRNCICCVSVATSTSVSCVTIFGTSGFGYNRIVGVTESINGYGLSANLCVANCTISYIIIRTCVYTIGSNIVFYSNFTFGVCNLLNSDSFTAKFFATNGTVNYVVVRTGFGTGGSIFVFLSCFSGSVTGSSLFNVGCVITSGTSLICIPTNCCTSRSLSFVSYFIVTESINGYGLSANLFATNGTVNYIIIRTCVYAIGSNIVFYSNFTFGVCNLLNSDSFTAEFFATNGTVNYIVVRTGSSATRINCVLNNSFSSGVICKLKSLFGSAEFYITFGTVNNFVVRACNGTSRFNSVFFNSFACSVILCINVIILVAVTTSGTSIGGITLFGTGGISYNTIVIAVTGCRSVAVIVAVATCRTSMSCITLLGTSRSGYFTLAVVMSGSRSVGVLIGLAARASMSCITLLGTSGSGYFTLAVVMSGSGSDNKVTLGTNLGLSAGCRTAGSVACLVSGGCNLGVFTIRTGFNSITTCCTGRSDCSCCVWVEGVVRTNVYFTVISPIRNIIGSTSFPTILYIYGLYKFFIIIIAVATEDDTGSIYRNLYGINIITSTVTIRANLSHSLTRPSSVWCLGRTIPIVNLYISPQPVVLEIDCNHCGRIVTTGICTFTTTVEVMTLCYGEGILIGRAASAGVSCITLCCTGSSSYCNRVVIMTVRRLNKLATYSTILRLGTICRLAGSMVGNSNISCLAVVAGFAIALLSSHGGAGGFCYLSPLGVGVTEYLVENNLTYGTDLIVLTIRFCTGSMTLCCNRSICVSILTNGTGMSGVTVSGTGRICYNGAVGVTKLRAGVGYSIGSITSVTLSGLSAVSGTGCVAVRYIVSERVTKLRAGVGYGIGSITSVTLSGLSAVVGTGCVAVRYIVSEGVTKLRVKVFSGILCFTSIALCSLGAIFKTGCIAVRCVISEGVTKLRVKVFSGILCFTSIALCSLGAIFKTGCIAVRCVISEGVTKLRVNIFLGILCFTSIALCSLGTIFKTGCVAVRYIVSEGVTKLRICISSCVGYVTSVALCSLGTVCGTGCFAVRCVISEGVTKLRVNIFLGILCFTSIALCSLGTIFKTGCVAVRYIVSEGVTKSLALSSLTY